MRESDTYMAIIDEGQAKHARSVILRLGKHKLGIPHETTIFYLDGIEDIERLERMTDRVMWDATSWQDVLDTP